MARKIKCNLVFEKFNYSIISISEHIVAYWSNIIVVHEEQCSPAAWQNDRLQAAAAHSVRSHAHTHTHLLTCHLSFLQCSKLVLCGKQQHDRGSSEEAFWFRSTSSS